MFAKHPLVLRFQVLKNKLQPQREICRRLFGKLPRNTSHPMVETSERFFLMGLLQRNVIFIWRLITISWVRFEWTWRPLLHSFCELNTTKVAYFFSYLSSFHPQRVAIGYMTIVTAPAAWFHLAIMWRTWTKLGFVIKHICDQTYIFVSSSTAFGGECFKTSVVLQKKVTDNII